MLYTIHRTSDYSKAKSRNKPCEKAFKGTVEYIEEAEFSSPEEYNEFFKRHIQDGSQVAWLEKGFNHRVNEKGHIVRNLEPEQAWFINIDSIYDLYDLIREVGPIILGEVNVYDKKTPDIEIYDYDWSE